MRLTSKFLALAACVGLMMSSAQPAEKKWQYERTVQKCEIAYVHYILRQAKHKAVATTGGRPLGVHPTACGFAAGHKTVAAAKAAALVECRKSEGTAYPGKCQIIEAQ